MNKFMKNASKTFGVLRSRGVKVATAGAVATGAMLASTSSWALDAAVTSAITAELTSVQADAVSIAALVWPVLVAIAGMVIGIKLFKRFIGKV